MNGRVLLNAVRALVIDRLGADRYDEMVNPPTREQRRAARFEELREAGLLDHPSVEVA